MKAFPAQLAFMVGSAQVRRDVAQLLRLLALLLVLLVIYSVGFHYLMAYEGRGGEFTWFTGFYWAMTVMSTLGFGDITFHSDLGRAFAVVVLVSGLVSLLIIFPFTFIQFFWAPWLEAQRSARAPRQLPAGTSGHAIITAFGSVAEALVRRLGQHGVPYVLLVPTLDEALELHDRGLRVMVGDPDNPEVYHRARVQNAALVAATGSDEANTNAAFTVRQISETVPVVSLADRSASEDILELAGSSHVLLVGEMLGQALARRAPGSDAVVHTVGRLGQLCIAELVISHTPLAGLRIRDSRLRERYGVTIAGLWDRGQFCAPQAESILGGNTVAIVVGSEEQLAALNADLMGDQEHRPSGLVIVIGGGRVGRAAAAMLQQRGAPYRVVERDPAKCPPGDEHYVTGDAAELSTLQRAGLTQALAVIMTTQDDDTNIYLTIYCRRLRPDMQVVCRATHERNVDTLHRAGADFVMSYASLGAGTIFNHLSPSDLLLVAEGLSLVRVPTPPALVGRSIAESAVASRTGCSIVALIGDGQTIVSPPPATLLSAEMDLVVIGNVVAESQFMQRFGRQETNKRHSGRTAQEP